MGISLHNELLNHIEEMDEYSCFRQKMRSFSLQHEFYSVKQCMSC